MRLLLISLQSNAYVTGLKYIAANVLANGHDARILLLPGYFERILAPAMEDFILDYSPDLIGIGLMSIEFYPAKNLTFLLREKFQIPIIWGGVHVVIRPNECIKYADYICCGEGERVVVSLLEHLKDKDKSIPPEIPNIWVNDNGKILRQSMAPPEMNLDSLPLQEYLPDYFYGFHKNKIYNFAQNPRLFRQYALYGGTCHMMITSRGCPFHCGYCANSYLMTIYGKKVRERSVENCIKELKEVKKDQYVLYINFEDDSFFIHSHEWIRRFCNEYKRYINLPFMVRVYPSNLDREKIFLLRGAGLSWVVMGVQSGSDRVNFEVYERNVSFSSVINAARIVAETKAAPFYEMIVDNPYETEEDQMETIDSMARLKRPYAISLAHLTFFQGTPLTEKAVKDNIIDPEAYLTRYMVKIDKTYFNKLLYMTPYIPRIITRYLNKPKKSRKLLHLLLVNSLFFIVKRTIEPTVYFFITTRALNYNIAWTIRTVLGNWGSAISKLLYNYLGEKDLKYGERLALLKKTQPALFKKG
ncbi:MAG: radical SAM protein [Thermodesulfovibrionia bacterium]|nr:radical SAM protein [Thermodesulfovibrionia bacterium]